jgi:hypothetical protein
MPRITQIFPDVLFDIFYQTKSFSITIPDPITEQGLLINLELQLVYLSTLVLIGPGLASGRSKTDPNAEDNEQLAREAEREKGGDFMG